jgi:hypothetical protein
MATNRLGHTDAADTSRHCEATTGDLHLGPHMGISFAQCGCRIRSDVQMSVFNVNDGVLFNASVLVYICSFTNKPAIPIPVPMHMVVSRTLALRRRHSLRPVTICLAPVQPRGCP